MLKRYVINIIVIVNISTPTRQILWYIPCEEENYCILAIAKPPIYERLPINPVTEYLLCYYRL